MGERVGVVEGWRWIGHGGVPDRWVSGAGLYFVWRQAAVERKDTVLDVREMRTAAAADDDDAKAAAAAPGAAAGAICCYLFVQLPTQTWGLVSSEVLTQFSEFWLFL